MGTWPEVRAHIAGVLEDVRITLPLPIDIEHVQEHPPKTVSDFPCFVILPVQDIEIDVLSGWRTETREVACRYMGRDGQDYPQAAEIADAFREAAIAAFDSQNGLGGYGILLSRRAEGLGLATYGGLEVIWFDLILEVRYETGAEQS